VTSNPGQVEVSESRFDHGLSITNNGSIEIEANTVTGTLACSGNNITGQTPSTATHKTGQCF
jgi:hypothetical protein